MRTLRDYQREAIEYLQKAWAAGFTRPPAVLATGLGKTEIFTDPSLLDPFLTAGKRVLIIAHTDELIDQAAKKARRNNPGRTVGIVKAAMNQTYAQIIVSSRQTLGHPTGGPRRLAALRNVGLIVIDEAHHALRTNSYGKILEHFGCFDDDATAPVVAGFTATLARGDKEKLSTVWQTPEIEVWEKREGSTFKRRTTRKEIFRRDILFGIRRGYLLDVVGKRIVVPDMDLSKVRQSGGDYQDNALAEELERTFAPEVAAENYLKYAADERGEMRKGIAFWPLVATAEHGARAFNEAGIRSEVIHGQLDKPTRRAVLHRLHTGETRVVHGVGVLTEGFDEPTVDVVVIARPTRSAPLFQQMVGRVLRPNLTLPPAERGKALLLDVVGAGAAHDLRSLIDLSPERPLRRDPNEELSLAELDDMLLLGQETEGTGNAVVEFEEEVYRGETAVKDFDPLGREKLWAQTPGGTWFMSAGSAAYAVLVPSVAGEPAHYDVVLMSKQQRGVKPWAKATEYVDLPMDMALGWAEDLAIEVGGSGTKTLTSRKSAWRKEGPTAGQLRMAGALQIDPRGMTKGELSERIDAVQAERRIDPLVAGVLAAAARAVD